MKGKLYRTVLDPVLAYDFDEWCKKEGLKGTRVIANLLRFFLDEYSEKVSEWREKHLTSTKKC